MPHMASVFSQLLEPLDRRVLNRIVARHDGDRAVGSGPNAWTCVRHLRTMLFAQFSGLNSLREIEQGLAAHPSGLYHLDLRLPRRSTLSDAQGECQEFRVWTGIMGKKESHYVSTQRTRYS